jgi:hypothetical protein
VHFVFWGGAGALFLTHPLVLLLVLLSQAGANVPATYVGGGGAVAQPPSANATSNIASCKRPPRSAGRFCGIGASCRCDRGVSIGSSRIAVI